MIAVILLMAAAAPLFASEVQQIVKQAIDYEIQHQRQLDQYTWQETRTIRRVNKRDPETSVWDRFQIDGSPYKRLVEKNGKPLSEPEARREQEKMDRELARRRTESPSQRDKRTRAEAKERADAVKFREEVLRAFDFRIEGEETVAGELAWRISATPRAGFRPASRDGRMLAKIRGRVWVGQQSRQWLRFDLETLEKLTFGLFLASVAPGARISAEQMRVNPELWHPSQIRLRVNARALWAKYDVEAETSYRGFRRFASDSRVVETDSVPPNR